MFGMKRIPPAPTPVVETDSACKVLYPMAPPAADASLTAKELAFRRAMAEVQAQKELERMAINPKMIGMALNASAERSRPYEPSEKLLMRLNARYAHETGFAFIHAVQNPKAGNVAVFIIANDGKPLALEDDAALFPSDGLIGRINLLR